jgi:adenylylsulfate kinase-like enzyme
MENQRLYIAIVGLPARGKSTIATKLKKSLMHESVKARIFNNGDLRRKTIRFCLIIIVTYHATPAK